MPGVTWMIRHALLTFKLNYELAGVKTILLPLRNAPSFVADALSRCLCKPSTRTIFASGGAGGKFNTTSLAWLSIQQDR
jgi:hypothetical protein